MRSNDHHELIVLSFPVLWVYINIEINDEEACYTLPDEFLAGDLMQNVTKFESTGTFRAGERQRLLSSTFLQ